MSGIVGIYHRDGEPVPAEHLQALVDSLPFMESEAREVWVQGCVGLGQTRKPRLSVAEAPDAAIAHLHIVADVRLDARRELAAALSTAERKISAQLDDAQLLLHAYALWGQNCVVHLLGDFAFTVWDAKSQQLFCARDHFGIKPFYFAQRDTVFLFSNALQTLLRHPRISDALNDSAVGDFLLFGLNTDNASTTFRDVQRLPPAHTLVISPDGLKLRNYWSAPANGRIRFARQSQYVENFLAVWDPAVSDRLEPATGILLSGGLDSAAVAATAKRQIQPAVTLHAFNFAYQNAFGDRDPAYASSLAAHLAIPFTSITNNLRPFESLQSATNISPEPVDDPFFAGHVQSFAKIAESCSVVLSGEGADNLLHFSMLPYAQDLFRRRHWLTLASEGARYAWRRPFPWRGLAARMQRLWVGREGSSGTFPKWISEEFATQQNLKERWRTGQPMPVPPQRHPIHPVAHASLYLPQWTRLFELENSAVTRSPVEVRYPFLDLRVVEYLLAIPPFPYFFEKMLLRQSMADRVLDTVRLRPKTPYAGDPLLLQLQRYGPFGVNNPAQRTSQHVTQPDSSGGATSKEFGRYIVTSSLTPLHAKMSCEQVNQMTRPFCFNFWLQSVRRVRYN